MSSESNFQGFSEETIEFFHNLRKNNNKGWFGSHKNDYETFAMKPARAFITAMGSRLKTLSPDINAVPKVNKSLFKIHRDIRFSPDKSPYKTHLGIFFWEGNRPRMECSGFYFHLEPSKLMMGVGLYMFPRQLLDHYRRSVIHPEYGKELSTLLKKILQIKGFNLGGEHYKRVPAGYDPSHPNARLLLHNGLYVGQETGLPDELYSSGLLDYCWKKYRPLAPLHWWLVSMSSRKPQFQI
jgi:uncharacterized protein (TIGR02453 family)